MIRPITPADSAAVVALAVSSGLFPEEETDFLDKMLADYFAGKIEEGHVCLIDEEDRPLGVAYYAPEIVTDRTWNLLMIAIRGDWAQTQHCCNQPQSSRLEIGLHAAAGSSIGRRVFISRSNQP